MSGEMGGNLRKEGEGLKCHSPNVHTVFLAFSLSYVTDQNWFSRLARSATPSPLHTMLDLIRVRTMTFGDGIISLSIALFLDPLHPAHVLPQSLRYCDASIRLLIIFEDGHQCTTNGQS